MRGLMKLAGVARFDCVGSTQEFTCYMAGLASPPAITPAAGRPARCTVTLPGDTGSVGDVAPHRQQASSRIWRVATSPTRVLQAQITQRCTRYVAIHPIRRGAPDPSRCTRSEGVQCLRIGCNAASHNKPNRGHSLPTHHNRQHRTPPHDLDTLAPIPRKSRCTR